jgi:CelD/BcsL family acetyltransferase involved in cellulose biosynthesis
MLAEDDSEGILSLFGRVTMRGLTVRQINSLPELREQADRWDDLWRRSASTRPTSQAEQLAIWMESFAPRSAFRALVVEDEERFLAALPLVCTRRWGMAVAGTPGNAWTPGGELLFDHDCDFESTGHALVAGLRRYVPGLVDFDGLILESLGCRSLLALLHSARIPHLTRSRFHVPLVLVGGDWQAYLAARSKNHRRHLQNIARRANELGGVTLDRYEAISPGKVEPLLRECFELESAGWKGRAATAALNDPAAWQFFIHQARGLAETWQLAITVLRHDGRAIAFEYGWQTRGVRGVLKIGYDEAFAQLSPGQLLRARLYEQLFAEQSVGWIDFLGPASGATSAWATHRYEVGRSLAAVDCYRGQMAIAGCRLAQRLKTRERSDRVSATSKVAALPPNVANPLPQVTEPPANAACHST